MRVEWISTADRFGQVASSWEPLAEKHGSPFLRHAWFAAWWAAFGAGRELAVCVLWDSEELAAAFPLQRSRVGLRPLANAYTPFFQPLARDPGALRELIAAVFPAAPALTMPRVPTTSPAVGAIAEESWAADRVTLLQPVTASPYVDTCGSLDGYWSRLGGNARRDFRRCRRLLDGLTDVEYRVLEAPVDLDAELDRGFAVEGSEWKSARGTAIVDRADTLDFYRRVSSAFAAMRKLRLSTLSIGGDVVAFNLNLLDHERVWGLKGGYDRRHSRLAPGLLLILAEVERCFELRLRSLELLGDRAPWKRKLTREVRCSCTVGSYARRPLPLATYGYRRHVWHRLRGAYRRVLPRRARG